MGPPNKFVRYTESTGQPVAYGDSIATPVSRALSISLPHWGFVWNRPVGLRIEDGDSTRTLPIVDVTLLVQIGLLSVSLVAAIIAFLARNAVRSR